MKNEIDYQIEFLKYAIAYLENRIRIVDNKASILIAVQGVFLGLLTYVIKEIFWTMDPSIINLVSYVVLGVAFAIFIFTILFLLQTIRPSRLLIGLKVPFEPKKLENYVLWYDDNFPTNSDNYDTKIKKLNTLKIKENYEKLHFITLQLIRNKYRFYPWAVIGMKLLVIWSASGIIVLALLK